MNNAEKIIVRLKQATLSNTDEQLAKSLRYKGATTISGWRTRDKNMAKECFEYAKKNSLISLDWLVFGVGNMKRDEKLDPNKLPPKPLDDQLLRKIIIAMEQLLKHNTMNKDTSKGKQHGRMRQLNASEKADAILKLYAHFEHEKTPKYSELEKIIRLVV